MSLNEKQREMIRTRNGGPVDELLSLFPRNIRDADWDEICQLRLAFHIHRNTGNVRPKFGWCGVSGGRWIDSTMGLARPKHKTLRVVMYWRRAYFRADSVMALLARRKFGILEYEEPPIEDDLERLKHRIDQMRETAAGLAGKLELPEGDGEKALRQPQSMIESAAGDVLNLCESLAVELETTPEQEEWPLVGIELFHLGISWEKLNQVRNQEAMAIARKGQSLTQGSPGSIWLQKDVETLARKLGRTPTPVEVLEASKYKAEKDRSKIIRVKIPLDGKITWRAFQQRVVAICRKLGLEMKRGRPKVK